MLKMLLMLSLFQIIYSTLEFQQLVGQKLTRLESGTLKNIKMARKLQNEEEVFQKNIEKMLKIREKVEVCLKRQLKRAKEEPRIEFKDIIKSCAGIDYTSFNRFMNKMDSFSKEATKPHLSKLTHSEGCKSKAEECLYFLETAVWYVNKNYMLVKSIEYNRDMLLETMEEHLIREVFGEIKEAADRFDEFQNLIIGHKVFVKQLFIKGQLDFNQDRHLSL